MELKPLLGRTGYVETPGADLPVYRLSDREILLFDSGRESCPELLDLLDREDLRVRAVVCTHLHEDHIANNESLIGRHGAEIIASASDIRELRSREPVSYPISALPKGDRLEVAGVTILLLPVPGHTAGQTAYVTPDGVCCVGDALMTRGPLERSKIPYMEDVDRSMESMELLRQTDYPWYIAAHKGAVAAEELPALIDRNLQKELDLYELLRRRITGPTPMEQAVTDFIRGAGVLSPQMVEQDYVRETARARVLALIHAGEFVLEDELVVPVRRNG